MQYEIVSQPGYSMVEAQLEQGESIIGEKGAMVWMDPTLTMTTAMGGLKASFKRRMAGETWFQNTFTATHGPGGIGLSPRYPGGILPVELGEGGVMHMVYGAYLASTPDVLLESNWEGFRGLFKQGLFCARAEGPGTLFFNSFGSIEMVEVDGTYQVDTGYAVAWDPTLEGTIEFTGRMFTWMVTDQIVMQFTGKGRLWIQSRSGPQLASWINSLGPQRKQATGADTIAKNVAKSAGKKAAGALFKGMLGK